MPKELQLYILGEFRGLPQEVLKSDLEKYGRLERAGRHLHRFRHRIENRFVQVRAATFARCYTTHYVGTIFNHLSSMECTFCACKTLHDNLRILVNQY